jgi:hypothetical protein
MSCGLWNGEVTDMYGCQADRRGRGTAFRVHSRTLAQPTIVVPDERQRPSDEMTCAPNNPVRSASATPQALSSSRWFVTFDRQRSGGLSFFLR